MAEAGVLFDEKTAKVLVEMARLFTRNGKRFEGVKAGLSTPSTGGGPPSPYVNVIRVALASTTSASAISTGSQTVTPASMAAIYVGSTLRIDDALGSAETVTVTAVTSTTFTATFANSHATTPVTIAGKADADGYQCWVRTWDGSTWSDNYALARAIDASGGTLTNGQIDLGRLMRVSPTTGNLVYALGTTSAGTIARRDDDSARIDPTTLLTFTKDDGFTVATTATAKEAKVGMDYATVCSRLYSYATVQTLPGVTKICQRVLKNGDGLVTDVITTYETQSMPFPACASIGSAACNDPTIKLCCPAPPCTGCPEGAAATFAFKFPDSPYSDVDANCLTCGLLDNEIYLLPLGDTTLPACACEYYSPDLEFIANGSLFCWGAQFFLCRNSDTGIWTLTLSGFEAGPYVGMDAVTYVCAEEDFDCFTGGLFNLDVVTLPDLCSPTWPATLLIYPI